MEDKTFPVKTPRARALEVKVVLDQGAKMPTRAHPADAAFDLYCIEGAVIQPKESVVFDTGVHMAIPHGYCGLIVSKSGLNVNNGITSDGLIDSEYTGSIHVKLYNHGFRPYRFMPYEKITQIMILPIPAVRMRMVDKLEDTERGSNGFGSSGRR